MKQLDQNGNIQRQKDLLGPMMACQQPIKPLLQQMNHFGSKRKGAVVNLASSNYLVGVKTDMEEILLPLKPRRICETYSPSRRAKSPTSSRQLVLCTKRRRAASPGSLLSWF